jgi:hypothetical protein
VLLIAFYCAKQLHDGHSCEGFAGILEGLSGAPCHRGHDADRTVSGEPKQRRHE